MCLFIDEIPILFTPTHHQGTILTRHAQSPSSGLNFHFTPPLSPRATHNDHGHDVTQIATEFPTRLHRFLPSKSSPS